MIYIAIPSITPRLARCAIDAISRTTPEPHAIIVKSHGTHGENLDAAAAELPHDAEWLFTMDDDAAPLRYAWASWLRSQLGGLDYLAFGENMAVGCLYRVSYLREKGRTFSETRNPGDAFRWAPRGWNLGRDYGYGPWWLENCEKYRDTDDRLVFAHLGGGTIGHTWRHQGTWYPRIPTWLWPRMVDRYLRRQGL